MKQHVTLAIGAVAVVLSGGCGFQGRGPQAGPSRPTPSPLPTRPSASAQLDTGRIPSNLTVTRSGPYWINMTSNDPGGLTVVVGVNPKRAASDLEREVKDHRAASHYPPDGRHLDSGEGLSEVLGAYRWSRARQLTDEGYEREQIVIFAGHPADDVLVIGRAEYAVGDGEFEARLHELVSLTEELAPQL